MRPAHILLVEDNRLDVELTLDAFRRMRLSNTVHVAPSGDHALAYLAGEEPYADRTTYPLPALVLLDLKLPGIDGLELLRRIKATPRLKRIPIIVLTSSARADDRARCYDAGANGYLSKPVSFEDFTEVVRAIGEYWLTLNVSPPCGAAPTES